MANPILVTANLGGQIDVDSKLGGTINVTANLTGTIELTINTSITTLDYAFINAQAATYFAALETAGFTEVQSLSLYSLDFYAIKEDIDNFFISLDTNSLDTKMVAMYLFIGGTAGTHAINAINPGTHNLTFVNSPTHSATGTDWNGTTQYADTGFIANNVLTLNNTHMAYYSQDNTQSGECIGTNEGGRQLLFRVRDTANLMRSFMYNSGGGLLSAAITDARGLSLGSRRASNQHELYKKGISQAFSSTTGGSLPLNVINTVLIGARGQSGTAMAFTNQECSYASLGLGMTDTDATNHNTAVQQLHTDLGRAQ